MDFLLKEERAAFGRRCGGWSFGRTCLLRPTKPRNLPGYYRPSSAVEHCPMSRSDLRRHSHNEPPLPRTPCQTHGVGRAESDSFTTHGEPCQGSTLGLLHAGAGQLHHFLPHRALTIHALPRTSWRGRQRLTACHQKALPDRRVGGHALNGGGEPILHRHR